MRSFGGAVPGTVAALADLMTAGAPITDASMAELLRKERRWFMSFPFLLFVKGT
jgi:hypothetical protein